MVHLLGPPPAPDWADGISDLNPFFDLVGRQLLPELGRLDPDGPHREHWIVIEDAVGVELAPFEEASEPDRFSDPSSSGASMEQPT
jgi:hypothetical protein